MGLLIGLMLGVGLFLLAIGGSTGSRTRTARPKRSSSTARLLMAADIRSVSARQFIAATAVGTLLTFLVVMAISSAVPVAAAFGLFAAMAPRSYLRRRAARRRALRSEAWPDAVDNLVSAVRAGLSLPEALAGLAVSGPAELREPFARFGRMYEATGSFAVCLERLAQDLADPVGDRVVDALLIAREVGGSDLGNLLRTLARFLREDARTRGEVEARQSWTVNAARVALAAPWVVLLLLASQSTTIAAYNSAAGAAVLLIGGGVSYGAYRLMRRIGQLPTDHRLVA